MKTKLYLDKRTGGAEAKEFPVKIAINSKGSSAYIGTGIKVKESQWKPKPGEVVNHASMKIYNIRLAEKKLSVDKAVESLRAEGKLHGLTASGIKQRVEEYLGRREKEGMGVVRCFDEFIKTKSKEDTVAIYTDTKKKVIEFCRNPDKLTFEEVTPGWLSDFDASLQKTMPSANSRAIHE